MKLESAAGVLPLIAAVLAISLGLAQLPARVIWSQILGAAFACGIGFTMSLFIAGLALELRSGEHFAGDRLGTLVASVLSALIAYIVLQLSLPKSATRP